MKYTKADYVQEHQHRINTAVKKLPEFLRTYIADLEREIKRLTDAKND